MSYTFKILTRNKFTPSEIDESVITQYVPLGVSFTEKLDETLDIGQLTVRGIDRFQPYDMFDTVEVYQDGVVKFSMRIAGDSVSVISKDPLTYQHTLSLVEHTKILERFLISGKTFTQPTDGTTPYSLYDVIEILNNTSPYEINVLVSSTRVFELPTGDLKTFLESITSPEFTFKEITLREALNQVCSFVDGIPRLVRDVVTGNLSLTIDFIDEPEELIVSTAKLTSKSKQQDIDLYATSIVSEGQNIVSENDINESVEIYPSNGSWITPRSDKYVFNYEDSYIKTPKRIYNVNKLEQLVFAEIRNVVQAKDVYDFKQRFYYYDTFADFPVSPPLVTEYNITEFYVALDTGITREFNGTSYVIQSPNPEPTTTPKIRLYETFNDFTTTGVYEYDVYVDRETGLTYRYTGTQFSKNKNFDLNGNLVLNLSDRVYERELWNTLDDDGFNSRDKPGFYFKSNTLVYDYREPNIQLGQTSGLFSTTVDIEVIAEITTFEALEEDGYLDAGDTKRLFSYDYKPSGGADPEFYNVALFRTHYTPIPASQRIDIDKQDRSEIIYDSQIIANQQARSINLEFFANNLQGRIARMGNSDLQLENKIKDLNSVNYFNIKDFTDDEFIVTQRETIIYEDFCTVKYGLTKNYNMISKFIGVNSEIRQYEIGENNTLDRVLTTKEFVKVDIVNSGSGFDGGQHITDLGKQCYMETFKTDSELEPIRGGWFSTDGSNIPGLAPFSSNGSGNTLMFFQQLKSNISFGDRRTDSVTEPQVVKSPVAYSDVSARATLLQFNMFDKIIKESAGISTFINDGDTSPNFDTSKINNTYVESLDMLVEKDNREELGQLYVISSISKRINDVILGRRLFTKNRLVSEKAPISLKLYTYSVTTDIKLSKVDNLTVKPGFTSVATLSPSNFAFDYVNRTITITHPDLTLTKTAWVITDENDEVIIGCNQDLELLNVITLDFLNRDDEIKYKY